MARDPIPCPFCDEHPLEGAGYGSHLDEHVDEMSVEVALGWAGVLESALRKLDEKIDGGDA